jgi:hypothetical protein
MSLPHLLDQTEIPPPIAPPIPLDQNRSARRLAPSPAGLQVGLVWSGNPAHKRDRLRSIPLAQWAPLASIEGVQFTSLQVSDPALESASNPPEQIFPFVADCRGAQDFAETATILSKLDLIITVDTAVAHLAASMGKPVWVLLANAVDWRWGLRGAETAWYPSAKLFRQTTPGSWGEALAAVAEELRGLVRTR